MFQRSFITVDGLKLKEYLSVTGDIWFFKKSDRLRLTSSGGGNTDTVQSDFIGYRATAGAIRRRMMLEGFSVEQSQADFNTSRQILTDLLKQSFSTHPRGLFGTSHPLEEYLSVLQESQFNDWTSRFQEAVPHWIMMHEAESRFGENNPIASLSSEPFLNAMSQNFNLSVIRSHTAPLNFPCQNINHFVVAYLTTCPDETIFELNIAPLIRFGYDDDFYDLAEINDEETVPHSLCRESIEDILLLSATQPINTSLQRMCYASIITAMEAYLGDILRREIFSRPVVKERFVASYEPFKKEKLNLSQLYTTLSGIDTKIKDALDGLSLHKINTAMNIFSSTLLTEFPARSIAYLDNAVKFRHDIVHRNGRDTDGSFVSIDQHAVDDLSREVLMFTRNVDAQILDGLLQEHKADEPELVI